MTGVQRVSAHPILEPLDYDFTPERASETLKGDLIDIYNLLWSAGIATAMDGPAVSQEMIEVRLRISAADSENPQSLVFRAFAVDCADPGWGALLPSELGRIMAGEQCVCTPFHPAVAAAIARSGASQLDGNGHRHRSAAQCAGLVPLLAPPASWQVATVQLTPASLGVDRLIEMMEARATGRPATYADRLAKAMENGLIVAESDRLQVGDYGGHVLAALSGLPPENVIDAQYSSDLENALRQVETDPALAGRTLREFCARALGVKPALADWLDELEIEGESLNEALARTDVALPPAGSWESCMLPAGISPENLIRDLQAAKALRVELDEILAGPDRLAWKSLSASGRACRRLVAAQANDPSLRPEDWIVRASRDIALRWWIDLAPQEPPFSLEEILAGKAALQALDADAGSLVTAVASRLAQSL